MNISILNTENNQLSSPNNMLNIQNISDQYYYIVTHDNGLKSVLTSFERPLFEKLVQRIGYPAEWIEHGEHCAVPIDGMQYETFRPRGIQMDSGIDVHQTDELKRDSIIVCVKIIKDFCWVFDVPHTTYTQIGNAQRINFFDFTKFIGLCKLYVWN